MIFKQLQNAISKLLLIALIGMLVGTTNISAEVT